MGRVHKFKLEQMYVRKADCACMTQPLRGLGLSWGCGGFGGVLCSNLNFCPPPMSLSIPRTKKKKKYY